jgi:hypothetical protein
LLSKPAAQVHSHPDSPCRALGGRGGQSTHAELAKAVPRCRNLPGGHTDGEAMAVQAPLPLTDLYVSGGHPLHRPPTISNPGPHWHAGVLGSLLAKHAAPPYSHAKMCSHTTHSFPVSGMHRYSVATAQVVMGTHGSHMAVPSVGANVPALQVSRKHDPGIAMQDGVLMHMTQRPVVVVLGYQFGHHAVFSGVLVLTQANPRPENQ